MIVIKIGGSLGESFDNICGDIRELWEEGKKIVIVHGGGDATNELSRRLGVRVEKVVSPSGFESRRTTREVLDVYVMACAGKVNRFLVAALQSVGIPAVGLSGADGRLVEAERKIIKALTPDGKKRVIRDDYSGKIKRINVDFLRKLMDFGYLPVIAPLAFSPKGELLNVDGDTLASKIAVELSSEALVILSDVPGLLRDPRDLGSLIREIQVENGEVALSYAQGRMKKKVKALLEAVDDGVPFGVIAPGYTGRPLLFALRGGGTVFKKGGRKFEADEAGRSVWQWALSQGAFEAG
ncbi:MAG: [LysW]-aminoadipate kinase [Synergistetes bacterium]|nr:[LysW]-aminoadipate kinase [Synergistota bacterium]